MPHYLFQTAYTSDATKALIKSSENRAEAFRKTVESLGGKLEGAWMSFGEYDTVSIIQLPDNVSAAAVSMAVSAGGANRGVKTTPLMTIDESLGAMKKAATAVYRPPGSA